MTSGEELEVLKRLEELESLQDENREVLMRLIAALLVKARGSQ